MKSRRDTLTAEVEELKNKGSGKADALLITLKQETIVAIDDAIQAIEENVLTEET